MHFGMWNGVDGSRSPPRDRRNHSGQQNNAQKNRSGASSSNLRRFLESTTPSVPAHFMPKTMIRGWTTCDVDRPYFVLGDLWEAYGEWSAYGTGVPLVLSGREKVVQYYVPYLSGMQLYGESTGHHGNSRRPGDYSDGESYRDSSSECSSDCELERGLKSSRESTWSRSLTASMAGIDGLSCESSSTEGFSSDDSDVGSSQDQLLFEFFERDAPYSREPLADKILELSSRFPELKTLRSCDLSPASWMSVAWYPIYRIPTGPTLKDLDACFLTYHSLSTAVGGTCICPGPAVAYPDGSVGALKISLPIFGLALYKFKGLIRNLFGGCDRQLASFLLQAADDWLRLLQVAHPDYNFFVSHGAY